MFSKFVISFIFIEIIQIISLDGVNAFIHKKTISSKCPRTDHPIIGVVAQELAPSDLRPYFPEYKSYIAASYVKAVESTGARVVPILINQDKAYYRNILKSVNGILMPGGAAIHGVGHPYYDTIKTIYHLAVNINNDKNEVIFPIYAVCLAFEFLLEVSNDDNLIVHNCTIYNEVLPIDFVGNYNKVKKTNMYSDLTKEEYNILKNHNVTAHWHTWCISEETFKRSKKLTSQYDVTSFATNSENKRFINSVEHKKYPFYGTQFHPEKAAFEWYSHWNHSEHSVRVNRYFYDFLTRMARFNNHKFNSEIEESNSLINNYKLIDTRNISDSFGQIYVFK